nr:MAG TPA: hypothetical protein [Caudoviricetes sp.]
MTYTELRELFWGEAKDIVSGIIKKPDKFIRWRYPEGGAPDWKISDDIVFLYLAEADDDYAKQRDSLYRTDNGTVYRDTVRTRVWELQATAYGRKSYELVNLLKDGFFYDSVQRNLAKHDVFIIPNLPTCMQAPELFAGKWWDRWDITLRFNELYRLVPEDVGHIDRVQIGTLANNP